MSEHLRYLAAHSRVPISCMPNAGLPELTANGAYYPVTPDELANAHETFVGEFGLSLVGGCCGTTPDHLSAVRERLERKTRPQRRPRPHPGGACLDPHVPFLPDPAIPPDRRRSHHDRRP